MILKRSHLPWAIFVVVVTVFCAVIYLANYYPVYLPVHVALPGWMGPVPPVRHSFGATPFGLILGTVSLAIFVFASALGIRKKKRVWKIGNVKFWLKAHIWLTILTVPLVAMHCGFAHGGPMTSTLLLLYIIVMGSGFFGLGMQQFMPRLMTSSLQHEFVYEEIPYMKTLLVAEAEALRKTLDPAAEPEVAIAGGGAHRGPAPASALAKLSGEDPNAALLRRFLDADCLPYLRSRRGDPARLEVQKSADNIFRLLKLGVEQKWWDKVDNVQTWCDERRQMDLQVYLHHWLHGWLIVHIPISFALLVFTFWHAYVTVVPYL